MTPASRLSRAIRSGVHRLVGHDWTAAGPREPVDTPDDFPPAVSVSTAPACCGFDGCDETADLYYVLAPGAGEHTAYVVEDLDELPADVLDDVPGWTPTEEAGR